MDIDELNTNEQRYDQQIDSKQNKTIAENAISDGILLIDKEQEWTSFDVVAKLRNVLHIKKIGHAGTLDPMATGLLVVLVGRKATRLCEKIMGHEKEYEAVMRLGVVTDTQDIWGNVIGGDPAAAESVTDAAVRDAVNSFTGELDQLPPMYSAIKIKGQKLCDVARRGEEVEREPRRITVARMEILSRAGNDVSLRVRCSSGTYIRTLCHDIGASLGCGACMSSLRRTRIGDYSVSDAHKVSEITDGSYIRSIE